MKSILKNIQVLNINPSILINSYSTNLAKKNLKYINYII